KSGVPEGEAEETDDSDRPGNPVPRSGHGRPVRERMLTGQRHVAGGHVDLKAFQQPSTDETPQERIAEHSATSSGEHGFARANRNGSNDRPGAEVLQRAPRKAL